MGRNSGCMMQVLNFCVLLSCGLLLSQKVSCQDTKVFACDNPIYCQGPLLKAAQNAYIYKDSKSFVDMKMKEDQSTILLAFENLLQTCNGTLTDDEVKEFVHNYFDEPGSEFTEWNPTDWVESPGFLDAITDEDLNKWLKHLNSLWKVLGRQLTQDVFTNSHLYSMIPVQHPMVVPGGRFREYYYWDSYWTVKGLLLCEMTDTVKGMLQNFFSLVDQFGFVPNGGRIYYKERSQPPFLTLMVKDYYDATGDASFFESALPYLQTEYEFWMNNRSIDIKGHVLNYYNAKMNQPRPESFREDTAVIDDFSQEEDGLDWMTQVISGVETGWGFSTRWAGKVYDSSVGFLPQLLTRDVVPVDLNSILAKTENALADFYKMTGDNINRDRMEEAYRKRTDAMEELLWNEHDGCYHDYSISDQSQIERYYASNVNPLWTKCYPQNVDITAREEKMYQYLLNEDVLKFPGGIPISKIASGQQWDFPNTWPPIMHMIIEGMATSEVEEIQHEAFVQSERWIRNIYKAYKSTDAMFEKYDVTIEGAPGGGGEQDVQIGFGWTNAVAMTLMDRYGGEITSGSSTLSTCFLLICHVLILVVLFHFI